MRFLLFMYVFGLVAAVAACGTPADNSPIDSMPPKMCDTKEGVSFAILEWTCLQQCGIDQKFMIADEFVVDLSPDGDYFFLMEDCQERWSGTIANRNDGTGCWDLHLADAGVTDAEVCFETYFADGYFTWLDADTGSSATSAFHGDVRGFPE